jgi:hypothetical protein
METQRETVKLPARLNGMEQEAHCVVEATKIIQADGQSVIFAELVICDAPEELPDGPYQVTFEEQMRFLTKHAGEWTVRS